MKIIDLGSRRQGHWQPVRSAILATAGLLISLDVVANTRLLILLQCIGRRRAPAR